MLVGFVVLEILAGVMGAALLSVMGAPAYMGAIIGVGVCAVMLVILIAMLGG
jgi:hypothetical protein